MHISKFLLEDAEIVAVDCFVYSVVNRSGYVKNTWEELGCGCRFTGLRRWRNGLTQSFYNQPTGNSFTVVASYIVTIMIMRSIFIFPVI